jgi:hypothetical protein
VAFLGGFFGIEFPPAEAPGIGSYWGMPPDPALTFVNARSALSALLASVRPPTLWLPAYICRSVPQAAAAAETPVRYFPVDVSLQPDIAFLDAATRAGDMVLAVDYFGRAPDAPFLDFVAQRQDLRFVEDGCHAVDTGAPPWGRWCLRSPRKLVGVPDGGFIAPGDDIAEPHRSRIDPRLDAQRAACLRFEDEEEQANPRWHAANQERETAENVSRRRMSRLARELLARLPVEAIARQRRDNFQALAESMSGLAFLPDQRPAYVPLGFPVRLPPATRSRVRADLIEQGIFPAVHWDDLPSPASFAVAHGLAGELLTLPCDQRYGTADMERVADVLRQSVRRP